MASIGIVGMLLYVAIIVLIIASAWIINTKAGQPGWACLVPIYSFIVLLNIVKKPTWWFFLLLIPFVNLIIAIIVTLELAKVFGKGTGFGVGLLLLPIVFYPMLAFGDATYVGGSPVSDETVLDN